MSQTWPVTLVPADPGTVSTGERPAATRIDVRDAPVWARSHTVGTAVQVLRDGEVTLTLDTVIDGGVTLDQTAASRGRVDLTIVSLELVPSGPTDALAPYGNELRVWRADGGDAVSLGIFRIDEAVVTDQADGLTIAVSGLDRSVRLIDAKFEEPLIVQAGTNFVTAMTTIVQAADPSIIVDLPPTSLTTPLLLGEEGGDRWAFLGEMATSLGWRLYFDGNGFLTGGPVSSPASEPAMTAAEGSGGVLISASKRLSRVGASNRIIATGENAAEGSAPVRGVATDDDPLSPTYYFGPFGKVPKFYSSQALTTDAQALDAATGLLNRELGVTQQVDFGSLVNPELKPDDVVRITRPRLGVDENHVVDSVTIPLTATGTMTASTRAMAAA